MKKEENPKICPKCNRSKLHPDPVMNALSRTDNKTYICQSCGVEEAFAAYLARFGPGHSER